MKAKALGLLCVLLLWGPSTVAQEGHPLSGSWYGDFGSTRTKRNDIVVVLSWDTTHITGIVNPGPAAARLKVVTLDSKRWTVHFEVEAKNPASGKMETFIAEGQLDDLGSPHRTIAGTWVCGDTKGDFKIRRE